MQPSAYDLKAFYKSGAGSVVRSVLLKRIQAVWPDLHDLDVLGMGYALPYEDALKERAARLIFQMPVRQGIHTWPDGGKNCVSLTEWGRLPFDNNTIDRVLLIHGLEFFNDISENLQEIWRVLRPNGRLIIVVPNRVALWAQADWTPFGKGRPYTRGQLSSVLMGNRFVIEHQEQALYFPPLQWAPILKIADFLEKYSRYVWPLGGVHIVEVSKQLYAPVRKDGSGSKVPAQSILGVRPNPAPQMRVTQMKH